MAIYKIQGNRDFNLAVVGESFYQENLEAICGGKKQSGDKLLAEACLTLEPDNPFDKYAVRVDIDGKQVGYLPKEEAREYHDIYNILKIPLNTQLLMSAQIRGGWKRKNGEEGHYGVWLDFPTDKAGAAQFRNIAKTPNKKIAKFDIVGCVTMPFRVIADIINSILNPQTRRSSIVLVSAIFLSCLLCFAVTMILGSQ